MSLLGDCLVLESQSIMAGNLTAGKCSSGAVTEHLKLSHKFEAETETETGPGWGLETSEPTPVMTHLLILLPNSSTN